MSLTLTALLNECINEYENFTFSTSFSFFTYLNAFVVVVELPQAPEDDPQKR